MTAKWDTIADRLRWAIDRMPREGRQRGERLFQRKVERRAEEIRRSGDPEELTGYHLNSIRDYLSGKTLPSPIFIREAAAVVGVRATWLLDGSGKPTDAEEQAMRRVATSLSQVVESTREAAAAAVEERFEAYRNLPDPARVHVVEMIEELLFGHATSDLEHLWPPDAGRLIGERVGHYLCAPFTLLGSPPSSFGPVELALIVDSLARPVQIAARARELASQEESDG